jgi:hypothetical protein
MYEREVLGSEAYWPSLKGREAMEASVTVPTQEELEAVLAAFNTVLHRLETLSMQMDAESAGGLTATAEEAWHLRFFGYYLELGAEDAAKCARVLQESALDLFNNSRDADARQNGH